MAFTINKTTNNGYLLEEYCGDMKNTKGYWSCSGGLRWPNTLLSHLILAFYLKCYPPVYLYKDVYGNWYRIGAVKMLLSSVMTTTASVSYHLEVDTECCSYCMADPLVPLWLLAVK